MRKMKKIVVAVITIAMLCGVCVQAAGSIQLVQIHASDQDFFLYVRGIEGDAENVKATIGNVESENVQAAKLQDLNASICTYIMIDNSISMPEKSREGIKNLLTELVAAKADNEKFAIAAFGETINQIIGYTNDYFQLKECIANIEFTDQKTYLTDMVYDVIDSGAVYGEDGDYVRILLIADGADDDSVGYTEEELKALLVSAHIPVYSLGVYNKKKSNNTQLENIFALSRLTGGNGYIFDDVESVASYNEMLAMDRNITVFDVTPKAESLDGSEKTIRLSFSNGDETTALMVDNVRMGVKVTEVQDSETEESEPVEEMPSSEQPIVEETESPQEVPETVPETGNLSGIVNWVIIGAAVFLALIVVMLLLLVRSSKKRRSETKFESIANADTEGEFIGAKKSVDEKTQMIDKNAGEQSVAPVTQYIWENAAAVSCVVTLKDVAEPARHYQEILKTRLLVGKSQDCNIVIATDPTISRKHCSIECRNGLYYLKDEKSSNGTFVNDSQIMAETQIKNGDIIRIGKTRLEFSVNM